MICMKCGYNDNIYHTFYSHTCFKKLQREFNQRLIDRHNEKESKMISAKQAVELVENSETLTKERLEKIGKLIEIEANLGKRELTLTLKEHDSELYKVKKNPYSSPNFTPIQRLIALRLEAHGYRVKIESHEYDASKGFKSMETESRIETAYNIVVRW